jgi:hypothetical protein
MRQVSVSCSQTAKVAQADVLEESTKRLKVAIVGTNITLQLFRDTGSGLYVGNFAGLEFTCNG